VTGSPPSLRPVIYLDRSVIEDAIKGHMRPRDRAGVCRLAAMVSEDVLSFYCPVGGRRLIEGASPKQREKHAREYSALTVLSRVDAGWLGEDAGRDLVETADCRALADWLGNAADARSILHARSLGVHDLVAADSSCAVKRMGEIEGRLGLRVFRPADYLSRWSTQQRLHG
jgi:hypothetical protein